jgi:Fe-S-cluster containining protein
MMELDLQKYGLSHLQKRKIKDWSESDIDELLNAFEHEDIAPTVTIPFTKCNITELLDRSYCRRCGKCCLPNPLNPNHPGVMVFEDELKLIARHSNFSYRFLKKRTTKYKTPDRKDIRRLPLPCMFYQKGECQIYEIRPFVCKIYPITDSPSEGKVYIAINVRCDYSKDLYKFCITTEKRMNPNSTF